MRKQNLLFLLVLGFPLWANCQIFNDPFLDIAVDKDQAPKSELRLGTTYNLGSNALTGTFYNAFFNSSFVDDNTKNSVLPYLKDQNGFGGYLHSYIYYAWQAKAGLHFFVDLASRNQYTARFSADAYKLLLYGNDAYAGQNLDVSGFNFQHYGYQSLQFGFYKNKSTKNGTQFVYGAGIALVAGTGYNDMSISKGSLFTSASGDSLSLNVNASSKSVSAQDIYTSINGTGASLNAFMALRFGGTNIVRFQVEDLGFVAWFHNITGFIINRQLSYTGEKVSVANGDASYTQYYKTLDTIAMQAGSAGPQGAFASALPFQVRFTYTRSLASTWLLAGGAEYINDNMPAPELDIWAQKLLLKNQLSIRFGGSAGGYGGLGANLGIDVNFGRKIKLSLGGQHVEGLLMANGHGQGFYGSLLWAI